MATENVPPGLCPLAGLSRFHRGHPSTDLGQDLFGIAELGWDREVQCDLFGHRHPTISSRRGANSENMRSLHHDGSTAAMGADSDRQAARERLSATVFLRLRTGAVAWMLIGPAALVFEWVAYRTDAGSRSVGCVVLTVLGVAVYRRTARPLAAWWCHAVGLGVWVVANLQMAFGFALDGSYVHILLVLMLMVALGLIEVSRGWVIAGLCVAMGLWLPLGFALHGEEFAMYALAVVSASSASIAVNTVITGFLIDLEMLRLRDRAREGELAAALADARHELAERERVEEERERLREQLLQAQKLDAIGTLAGGVAHDMNNTLAAIVGLAEQIREHTPGEAAATVDDLIATAQRGGELTRNLLGFSRRGRYRKVSTPVAPIVDDVANLLRRTLLKQIQIEVTGQVASHVDVDVAQITHALINLCLNAAHAMGGSGELRLTLEEFDVGEHEALALATAPGRYVLIRVIDTGTGMSRDVQARLFEPFFTTKPPGSGTGLGLAMVYGTMKGHGGAVAVASELDRGTTMTLYLPAVPALSKPATTAITAPPSKARLVLVVDDEPLIRSTTARSLERAGYRILCAADGQAAVEAFAARSAEVAVVVLDMVMPIMGGAACLAALQRIDPAVRVVIASGYAIEHEAQSCLDRGAACFLEKPFSREQLCDAIEYALRNDREPITSSN